MSWHHRQMESLCGSQFYMWRFYGTSEPQRLEVSNRTPCILCYAPDTTYDHAFMGVHLLFNSVNLQGPTHVTTTPGSLLRVFPVQPGRDASSAVIILRLGLSLVIQHILSSSIVSESIRAAGVSSISLFHSSHLAQCFCVHNRHYILPGRFFGKGRTH